MRGVLLSSRLFALAPVATVAVALLIHSSTIRASEELLVRAIVDGKPSSLFEKLVVTSSKASISKQPASGGDPIEPFAIFFKLKNDDGSLEKNGFVRVGDSTGKPLGWIKQSDVTSWNTRFILEPLQPIPERSFTVQLESGASAVLNTVPEGKRRFALVTKAASPSKEKGKEPDQTVVVYAGNVQTSGSGGTLARERNELRDLKLEVVFVIEASDFLTIKFEKDDDYTVGDSVKELIKQCTAEVRKNSELKGAVRFGLVEYQDDTKEANFISKLTCGLTDDMNRFDSKLSEMSPKAIGGDWPDDVIAGLNTAVKDSGWSQNSVKHIILLGASSCQIDPKGKGTNQFGGNWNFITKKMDRSNPDFDAGYNSSGLSIKQLIDRANPQAGSTAEKARNAKIFHTVLVGKEIPKLPGNLEEIADKIVREEDDDVIEGFAQRLSEKGIEPREVIPVFVNRFLVRHQRPIAREQYAKIAKNDDVPGMNLEVEPNIAKVQQAAKSIADKLKESFTTLAGVRAGEVGVAELNKQKNEVTQTLYAIVGASADKFKDLPVLTGTANIRDEKGREVAQKKVLVSMQELIRLKSTLDSIHKKFKSRTAKADRQDVAKILEDLQQATASTSAGQKFAADVNLKDIITDLPMRTTVLETTPRDIAVMASDTFEQWLNKLETSIFRIEDLVNGKAEWLELSSLALNEKFTFLRLNELP